jgi:hypothetical protein
MFMAGTEEIPINNGAVLNISQIIKAVMSSTAEAKLGALFINAKTAMSIFRPQILTSPDDPAYLKLSSTSTPKTTVSTTFVKNILKLPQFAAQLAAKQQTISARGASEHNGKGVLDWS